jgi:hypothetical protein
MRPERGADAMQAVSAWQGFARSEQMPACLYDQKAIYISEER